jgi:hypothetical protein
MANLFKTRFVPNPDGTDSATAITNANTAFVHTYIGDDLTGDGTREYPFKSVFKANQKSGITYIVFRGVLNEAFSTDKPIIGDDINQFLLMVNYSVSNFSLIQMSLDKFNYSGNANYSRLILIDNISGNVASNRIEFSKLNDVLITGNYGCIAINNTVLGGNGIINTTNCLFVDYINHSEYISGVNNYAVFSSKCIFKYNSVPIVSPNWTNNSIENVQLLRNAYLEAGMSPGKVALLFKRDSFDNETCKVIWEQKDGGTHPNIFNRYNEDGSIADFSLNPNLYNEALYAGDTGSFVGCFKPAEAVVSADWNASLDVNTNGTDTLNAGTLLRINVDDTIDFNAASGQIWNRLKCNQTIVIPNGIKFDGTPISSNDGTAFGYYFGKHQDLMNPTALTPADALEPNCIYKVCNPLRSIYQAAIFNGNQYLPDYFFKTGDDVLAFTLLNGDSGTVVKKVLAVPMESIEVIPYDDIATPSPTFPRFSSPMFGSCYMLYHKIGDHIDEPVLFSEVANDKIAYYDTWAVTNADQEFATLVLDTVNYYYKVPILKYLRTELNGHFNADYDQ